MTTPTLDASARFSPWQIRLHWLSLLLIALAYAAIEVKGLIPKTSPGHDFVKLLHFNLGMLVWAVMLVRVGLKLHHRDPIIVPALPRWQAAAARLAHRLLYATFLALPVLGVLSLAYQGKQWSLLGAAVPDFVTADRAIGKFLEGIHETWAEAGYFIIGLHAAAALFHHYVQRDNVLASMLPGRLERRDGPKPARPSMTWEWSHHDRRKSGS